jgi:hypothetical protein
MLINLGRKKTLVKEMRKRKMLDVLFLLRETCI